MNSTIKISIFFTCALFYAGCAYPPTQKPFYQYEPNVIKIERIGVKPQYHVSLDDLSLHSVYLFHNTEEKEEYFASIKKSLADEFIKYL